MPKVFTRWVGRDPAPEVGVSTLELARNFTKYGLERGIVALEADLELTTGGFAGIRRDDA